METVSKQTARSPRTPALGMIVNPRFCVLVSSAMARTLIEAGYVPVRKDARRDPVELIAAALEIGIDRWDRTSGASGDLGGSSAKLHAACIDIAVQVAAFDLLFEMTIGVDRTARWRAALVSAG